MPDKSIKINQQKVAMEIELINTPADRRKFLTAPCTHAEISALRAITGSLNDLARESRPDLSGP
eukprot:1394747-Alexandrium_andersonii.AAC.1